MTCRTIEISMKQDFTSDPELMEMASELKRSLGNRADKWFLTSLRSTELIKKLWRNWMKALMPPLSTTTMILCSQQLFDEPLERQWNCSLRFCHHVLIENQNAENCLKRRSALLCKRNLSVHIERMLKTLSQTFFCWIWSLER